MCFCNSSVCVCCAVRVQVRDREIKVNIFDMAGHPFFYEVSPFTLPLCNYLYFLEYLYSAIKNIYLCKTT